MYSFWADYTEAIPGFSTYLVQRKEHPDVRIVNSLREVGTEAAITILPFEYSPPVGVPGYKQVILTLPDSKWRIFYRRELKFNCSVPTKDTMKYLAAQCVYCLRGDWGEKDWASRYENGTFLNVPLNGGVKIYDFKEYPI